MNTFHWYQVEKKKEITFIFNAKELLIIANLFYGLIRISRKLIEKTDFYSIVVNFCAVSPHTHRHTYMRMTWNIRMMTKSKVQYVFMTIHQNKLTTKTVFWTIHSIWNALKKCRNSFAKMDVAIWKSLSNRKIDQNLNFNKKKFESFFYTGMYNSTGMYNFIYTVAWN